LRGQPTLHFSTRTFLYIFVAHNWGPLYTGIYTEVTSRKKDYNR
jgi:hypothetical protein